MHNRRKKSLEISLQDNHNRRILLLKGVTQLIKQQYREGSPGVYLFDFSVKDYELIIDFIPKILNTLGIPSKIETDKPAILIDFID